MEIQRAIDYFLTAKGADGLSERTTDDYAAKLYGFVRASGVEQASDITTQAVREYIASLLLRKKMGELSSATVAAQVRPLKVFCRFLYHEEPPLLAIDPFRKGGASVPSVEGKLHDTIPDADFRAMLATCDPNDPEGRRNHAILCFLFDTGVRVGELCNIKHADLDLKGRSCVVFGKGRRQRTVFFSGITAKSLSRYIVRMPRRYRHEEWLWTSVRRNVGGRITENGIGQMLRRAKADSGVTCRVNPHTFRHTFATNYLRAGGDLNSLMRLMGHADLSILQTYLNLVNDDLRDKHEQFSVMGRVVGRR